MPQMQRDRKDNIICQSKIIVKRETVGVLPTYAIKADGYATDAGRTSVIIIKRIGRKKEML
jgi:hypothetical protein